MALRGSATQANSTSSTSAIVTVGGIGIQNNDIVVLLMNGGGSGTNVYTYPSGFNAVPGLSSINLFSGFNTLDVAYKVAGGSEPSTYTVTSPSNDFQTLHCRVYSGRNTSSPFTAVATTVSTAAASFPISLAMTGLTAVSGDDIILWAGATGNGENGSEVLSLTGPAGFGNQGAASGAVSFSSRIAFADYVNNPGGATGTLSATWSNTISANPFAYAGFVLSLAQAAAAAGASIAWVK